MVELNFDDEIDLGVVRVVEIDLISVWGIVIDLVLEKGSQ